MKIELLRDAHAIIGESPTWVAAEQAIYWIDVKAPALHRLRFQGGPDRHWPLPEDVGAFTLSGGGDGGAPDAAIVALRHGLFKLDLNTHGLTLLAPSPFDPVITRFNEGACDETGRFWVGTMYDPMPGTSSAPHPASLHSFVLDSELRREPDAAELHNGMAWSPTGDIFYLAHTGNRQVFAYRFESATGRLGQRRNFAAIAEDDGVPDGAAVDVEGGYWCALHGASRLRRFLPDGSHDRDVMLPVSQPTMCAFAGPNLDLMVVTSASDSLDAGQLAVQPHAGGVFCFAPGIRGVARRCFVR